MPHESITVFQACREGLPMEDIRPRLADIEREHILATLALCEGNRTYSAEMLAADDNYKKQPAVFSFITLRLDLSGHIFTASVVMGSFAFAAGWTAFLIWLFYLAF